MGSPSPSDTVLVTGGAGYIGSHTVVALVRAGHRVVIADDLSNASYAAVESVRRLAGTDIEFVEIDLVDADATEQLIASHQFSAVIHFAGLKAVGESVEKPLAYYRTNLYSTVNLLSSMQRHEVFNLVFSSSATVYGEPEQNPIPETARTGATNPYGRTKLMIEEICADVAASDQRWSMTMLRYFNPVGADRSGDLGEDPLGTPNNLLPFVMQVAVGQRPNVLVFGDDFDTPDGTGVRDYIHVADLADGHLAALEHPQPGWRALNLGSGKGTSVLEIIEATRSASGHPVPYEIVGRRPGDVATTIADPALAASQLEWTAQRSVAEAIEDAWRWQARHPLGFRAEAEQRSTE